MYISLKMCLSPHHIPVPIYGGGRMDEALSRAGHRSSPAASHMPLLSLLALDIAHFFTYSFLSLFFPFKLSVMLFPETEKLMGT